MSTCSIKEDRGYTGVMWKTVSEACNLSCDYCYYSRCNGMPGKVERIDDAVLEKFIKEYMASSKGVASFAWQGGEPLLAGLDFLKKVVSLQAKYAPKNTIISNAIQTNGTLITKEWAAFFKKYNFLVGVSLDGPEKINDQRRVTGAGGGSFQSIMRGIQHLKNAKVDFNILTVIHENNVTKAKELMEFYDQEGFKYVQFIPCMDFQSQNVNQPGKYLITPREYGDFLCEAFDVWYNDGYPKTSIRFFDNMLSVYLHQEAELCTHRETCPKTIILERNGDAFPCDFYIHDDYKLGNVGVDNIQDILNHSIYDTFLGLKPDLPAQCERCEYLSLCHGGCPRNRNWNVETQGHTVEYFCQSFKQIYGYAHSRMEEVAKNYKRNWLNELVKSGRVLPGRNDECFCGSGKKFKKCCQTLAN
ncbi:anaerobic sulfatase maturase [Bacillaceae bacterium S4-13-56]